MCHYHIYTVFAGVIILITQVYAQFVTSPYVQNVKQNGITIMWESNSNTNGSVNYGAGTGYGNNQQAETVLSGGTTWIYKAVLTGLNSATTYHFQAVTQEGASADKTFVTMPSGNVDFSFGISGDTQGGSSATTPMIQHMMQTSNVDLMLSTGDLQENGWDYSSVRAYFLDRLLQPFNRAVPFYVAWGNHDFENGSVVRAFVDLPSKDRSGMNAGWGSYSFDYAGCHFICIDDNAQNDITNGWLLSDLQSEAAQTARFTFLFVHRPPYCERWLDGTQYYRDNLVPLMEQYGVDACFSGHTHAYERGQLNGIYYVIGGGGSWLDSAEPIVKDWPHITVEECVNEYVKVEISGMICTVKALAFNTDGSFSRQLDSFTMTNSSDPSVATSLEITPQTMSLESGMSGQFVAQVLDQYGHAMNPPPSIEWNALCGSGSIDASGLFSTSETEGECTVTARSGNLEKSAAVSVLSFLPVDLKIDCGANGSPVQGWENDAQYVSGGEPYAWGAIDAGGVDSAAPAAVYSTVRHLDHSYSFSAIPDATYRVRIHFADGGSSNRAMDYSIEGQLLIDNLNIESEAGLNKALVKEFNVVVDDGNGMQIVCAKDGGDDVFEAGIEIKRISETVTLNKHVGPELSAGALTVNMSNATMHLSVSLPGMHIISIYDSRGARIARFSGYGNASYAWHSAASGAGVYIVKAQSNSHVLTKQVLAR